MWVKVYYNPNTRQMLGFGTSDLPMEGTENVDWVKVDVELSSDSPVWDGTSHGSVWYYLSDGSFSQEVP